MTVFALADPPPGWRMRPLRAGDGRFRGVRYTGGRIGVGRYADFRVLGTPFESGTATWPARHTYADGLSKPWTGAAVWLGVIAIAISALAALGAGLLWSTRPARLPEEE